MIGGNGRQAKPFLAENGTCGGSGKESIRLGRRGKGIRRQRIGIGSIPCRQMVCSPGANHSAMGSGAQRFRFSSVTWPQVVQ
jgi:hypothetical protein